MVKKITNIFKKQINNVTMAATLVAVSSLASRFLGVVRDKILASKFGAGEELDIYFAAFKIPDLIYSLIVLGALSAGFIPIFTSLIKDKNCHKKDECNPEKNNKEAWHLASNIINILVIALSVLSVIGYFLAPYLMSIIAPGFEKSQQEVTAVLTRIMFLSPLLLGLSGIFSGILQSFKRFIVYSLAPIFYNLGIIFGALFLVDRFGLQGLAWGVVIGAFLHLIIQVPTVRNLGFRHKKLIDFKEKNTRKIFKMMVPRTMSLAISQINLVVITILASTMDSGSLTIFNLANNLQSFPVGIFGISFAIAAFPLLSETAKDAKKLAANFSKTFRQILFFIVPSTVLIIILRAQIIRVVYGSGNFDWTDTILTMNTLGFFALSLFAQATIPLLIRVFYANEDSKTPFYLGLGSVLLNIILSVVLSKNMGVSGLALAFSIASIVNFFLLFVWIYVKNGNIHLSKIIVAVAKFSISAIFAGGAAQATKYLVWPFIDMTKFSGVFIQLIIAGLVGGIIYLLSCYILKNKEMINFINSFKRRISFKKVNNVGDSGEARGL
ncbi:MAG: murein biosynthesis integral membrane protein MurJ [Patescibacteria group bacterium]|jgi:putative peptidoglycan lipid II flippase|nr:murein biosynthesis integral membrane protein MurJ [Patescibacteria group bacterium]